MTDYDLSINGGPVEPTSRWIPTWIDREQGLVRVGNGEPMEIAVVEGAGADWVVTLRGRRIPVAVRTWRERVLAEAESASRGHDGPIEVRDTLPGVVVAIAVREGD
jgi:hypothetical protein